MVVYLNLAFAVIDILAGLPYLAIVNIVAAGAVYALQSSEDRDEIESGQKLRDKLLASK